MSSQEIERLAHHLRKAWRVEAIIQQSAGHLPFGHKVTNHGKR